MTTLYTVIDNNGDVIDSCLTAIEAMAVILTDDGHEFEIRPEADGEGYRLWTTTYGRNSTAYSGLTKSTVYSLKSDEAKAEQEIAEKVIAARWPRHPEAMTDEAHAAMMAEIEADKGPEWKIGDRVEAGEGADHDTGTVVEAIGSDADHPMAADARNVYVAWDSGVRCWTPADTLTAEDGE